MSEILSNLNEAQQEAVTHTSGPLLIVAGAGTGKTTVMTRRIAWLIDQGHATPEQILALTFTEKAAAEMEERVDRLLPYGYVDLWISTFHAFCEKLLRQHGVEIGLAPRFQVLDESDVQLLVRRNLDSFSLSHYQPKGNPTKYLSALLQHVSRLKDEDVAPEAYQAFAEGVEDADEQARYLELAAFYAQYETLLAEHDALDFGGLIQQTLHLVRTRPEIRQQLQSQFRYVIVDEFQDTNWSQYALAKLLLNEEQNIAVVGDDDQAIYTFRGATLKNILRFEEDFPKTRHVVLTQNYRSLQGILDASYAFIQQNNPYRLEARLQERHGLGKELKSQLVGEAVVKHHHSDTLATEVRWVTETLQRLHAEHACAWSDIAILVRANDSAEPFLTAMDKYGVPYRFLAMRGLYRKPIVLDTVALLRLIDEPHHSQSAYRLLSHPVLGVPEKDLIAITHWAKRKGRAIMELLDEGGVRLSPEGSTRVRELLETLSSLRALARRRNALEVCAEALKQSGIYGTVIQLEDAEQVEQAEYLQQFYERIRRYVQLSGDDPSLHGFLQAFAHERSAGGEGALAPDSQSGPDEVQVMTLHGAKGLEFRFVFIVNMVDRRFPASRRADPIPLPEALLKMPEERSPADVHLEEERRLFYVGLTRAKEQVYLTSANDYGGVREKKLSRFLAELGHVKPEVAHTYPGLDLAFDHRVDHVLHNSAALPLPKAFSFTQLTAYDHCPLQYKFAHVLKVPVFGSWAMSFGKTMHNTLQRFFEELVERGGGAQAALFQEPGTLPVTKDRLMELYANNWIDEWYVNSTQREEYLEEGRASLSAYYDHLVAHPPTPLFLEKGFTIKIDDIVVRGRVDRIDRYEDGVEIIDYKTGTPKTAKDLTATDKLQLLLYQLAARDIFGLEPKRLTFHYLRDHSQVSFLGTEEELDRLRDTIRERVGGIRQRLFDPTPGFMCRYCDFKDICPFRAG